MKCSKCKEEMEEGVLDTNGSQWKKASDSILTKQMLKTSKQNVIAYKCKQCDKIELYVKDENSSK